MATIWNLKSGSVFGPGIYLNNVYMLCSIIIA
jgi:hypothetical protein